MIELNVEYGRMSEHYNHFAEYCLCGVEATDTRLMGVIAMRLNWKSSSDADASFHQIIHLDYSEYGIDDYFEYECIRGEDGYDEKLDEMKYRWKHFVSVMGGKVVKIDAKTAVRLIDEAVNVWKNSTLLSYGDFNEKFREGALSRIELMKEALGFSPEPYDSDKLIEQVSPKRLTACETINYFLMRLVDCDFPAAEYLSSISPSRLRSCEIVKPGIQTLISNEIRSDKGNTDSSDSGTHCYHLNFITLSEDNYYLGKMNIYLSGGKLGRDRTVSAIDIGFFQKLSSWESAMLIKRPEYITVYDVPDNILRVFDYTSIPLINDSEPQLVGNGWQFTIYKNNNSHVDSINYHLNSDILGSAALTIPGELIVMSYSIMDIMLLENSVAISPYGPELILKGRYQVTDMVFASICETTGVLFNDVIRAEDE